MMQNRLNRPSIEKYSIAYAKKLADTFFSREETINGRQILALSHLQQLNLLVIRNLLQRWRKEADKLQSPYFDYNAGEVQDALTHFMNALSQNIAIKRHNFEPLLKKSTRDAMMLLFSPYDFYTREINHTEKTSISLGELKESSKYIKVNRSLLEALISRFERDGMDEVSTDEALDMLEDVARNTGIAAEPYEHYLQQFSMTLPLSIDMVYQGALPNRTEEERLFREKESAPAPDKAVTFAPEPPEKAPVPPAQESPSPLTERNLNDNFFREQTTLNDRLGSPATQSLADIHQRQKIDSIKQHITLNQKFMFINALFSGNKEEFGSALDKLEKCSSYSEAMQLLNHDYINKYNWNMAKEEVKDFIDVVSKKYA